MKLRTADEIALSDADAVDAARSAYEALTQEQRSLESNYARLESDEARISA